MTPTLDLDKLRKQVEAAQAKWAKDNLSNVAESVNRILNDALTEVIAKTLGLDNHWGDWEIDHCNGRNGIFTTTIREQAQSRVTELIADAIGTFELNTQQKQAVRKEYREAMMRALADTARHQASKDAGEVFAMLIAEDGDIDDE